MLLKLTRAVLVGDVIQEAGDVITADGKYAEQFVRSGAAVPFVPPVETATAPPRAPERAVGRPQRQV